MARKPVLAPGLDGHQHERLPRTQGVAHFDELGKALDAVPVRHSPVDLTQEGVVDSEQPSAVHHSK